MKQKFTPNRVVRDITEQEKRITWKLRHKGLKQTTKWDSGRTPQKDAHCAGRLMEMKNTYSMNVKPPMIFNGPISS